MSVSEPLPPPEPPPPPPPPARPGGRSGSVVAIVLSGLLALVGFLVLLTGIGVLAIHIAVQGDDGFFTVDSDAISTESYALTTKGVDLGTGGDWAPEALLDEIRIDSDPTSAGDLFLGIARTDDLDAYLGDVARAEITEIGTDGTSLDVIRGGAPSGPPTSQDFWLASSSGPGQREVRWEPEGGTYSVVVMNADGSSGLTATLSVGLKVGGLLWIGLAIVALALLLLVPGLLILIRAFRAPTATP